MHAATAGEPVRVDHQEPQSNPAASHAASVANAMHYRGVGGVGRPRIAYKIQNDLETTSLIDNTYINQKRDSEVSCHTFSFGGNIVRNNLNFYQNFSLFWLLNLLKLFQIILVDFFH